jgi:hypothetical protein
MPGTAPSVMTLLTTVGLPNRPSSAGSGGLARTMPRLPSRLSSSAVSSPQMYGAGAEPTSQFERRAGAEHVAAEHSRASRARWRVARSVLMACGYSERI